MHKEAGEVRDFLPQLVSALEKRGAGVVLEEGYGSGMGLEDRDYLQAAPTARFAPHAETYRQDHVLVLRCPTDDETRLMRRGGCLISMLHFATRPQRVTFLRSLGLEAIALDSIKDDTGRRLIENLHAVAWNGARIAFRTLCDTYPGGRFESTDRPPIQVTLLGAGAVGSFAMQAAVHYGDNVLRGRMAASGAPGVQVTVIDHDITSRANVMKEILSRTDLLIDATQRPDPSRPVIPNGWVAHLPPHAVILDLSVDPYNFLIDPPTVKGIEGIPQGSLDQYIFAPDDPAYAALPACVLREHRRHVVSCYSWPGLYSRDCMQVYGRQLQPILRVLTERGGVANISADGKFFERAIARARLSGWSAERAGNARPRANATRSVRR
jgi:alanine dehydrogenase